ncbi:MAG: outer membrane beta-barrel protein [Rickettsiaceae bacterium]|nr:outer membrane beta-barrel protein [Rickettsiaceae bacterium]
MNISINNNTKSASFYKAISAIRNFVIAAIIISAGLDSTACKLHKSESKYYIGGFGGISKTLSNKIIEENTQTSFRITKPSSLYAGLIGYKITPGIATEFSIEYKKKYPIFVTLAEQNGGDTVKTNASARNYMTNFVYKLKENDLFHPYITLGLGIGRVKLQEASIPYKISNGAGGIIDTYKVKFSSSYSNSFSWEAGIGAQKSITRDLAINAGVNLHVTKNIIINSLAINTAKTSEVFMNRLSSGGVPTDKDVQYDKLKFNRTFGAFEIIVGFTYNLPI